MNLSYIVSQSKRKNTKGFTLIELLIVIAILGILAAGLLAALDPLDQLRRGRDTSRRSVATELTKALQRQYTIVGSYPWGTGATTVANLALTNTFVATLVAGGELKPNFVDGIPAAAANGSGTITLYADTNANLFTCFRPESKSGASDPSSIFTNTAGATVGGCPAAIGATTACYFCAR